jgi:hypothetical protein
MLKVVVDNKVVNVTLEFVDIKVANRIDSFKVAKFIDEDWEAAVCFLCDLMKFWIF